MSLFWYLYEELDTWRRKFWEQMNVCEAYEWVERLRMKVWHELKKEWDLSGPPLNLEEESTIEHAEKQDWNDVVEEVNGVLHVIIKDYMPPMKDLRDSDVRNYWRIRAYRAVKNFMNHFDKIICVIGGVRSPYRPVDHT